jgi:hypothetical protein
LLPGGFSPIEKVLFGDPFRPLVSIEVFIAAPLAKLVDHDGIDDPPEIGRLVPDHPPALEEFPNPEFYVLVDIFRIKPVFRQVVALDLACYEPGIVLEKLLEFFIPISRDVHNTKVFFAWILASILTI